MAYNRAPERWGQSNQKGYVVIDTMDILCELYLIMWSFLLNCMVSWKSNLSMTLEDNNYHINLFIFCL